MESIKKIYKSGIGPSSSHTMGSYFAANQFRSKNPDDKRFRVTLYGSLAATGKGHNTDLAILYATNPIPTEIIWRADINIYAMMSDGKHRISFDKVVKTMNNTGKDLSFLYKETAQGGLALLTDEEQ